MVAVKQTWAQNQDHIEDVKLAPARLWGWQLGRNMGGRLLGTPFSSLGVFYDVSSHVDTRS